MAAKRCKAIAGSAMLGALVACSPSHQFRVTHPPTHDGTSIDLTYLLNLPIVEVMIDGRRVMLIFDLGGHDTVTLQSDAVDRLDTVKRNGRVSTAMNAAGKLALNRGFEITQMAMGDVQFAEIEGHEIDFGGPEVLEDGADGYIGSAIMMRFDLLVDYPGDRVVLYPPGRGAGVVNVTGWMKCDVNLDRQTRGVVNGQDAVIGWDTGANHTVIDPGFAERLGLVSATPAQPVMINADLIIGEVSYWDVEMHTNELKGAGVDVLLGYNFFAAHRVFFDFTRSEVCVEPSASRR